ncbi:hypothetical protein ACFO4E_09585 [Nocardiopsis mangrovi]|uniref:Uncharacterized protein n=1 Tax=Nocardiopsis mangrovi TaxID=1179818 RepID=A0ABV9DTM7_9ACTN
MLPGPPFTRASFPVLVPIADRRPFDPPTRVWTPDEWSRIRTGLRAEAMEERWDAFVEGDRMFVQRSWTGRGYYEAEFAPCGGGHRMVRAWAEAGGADIDTRHGALHAAHLEVLVAALLLRDPDPAPWNRFTRLGGLSALYGRGPGGG